MMKKKDDKLREVLLDTACALANEQGIEKLNIRLIAKKAGVSSGTVYNYFSGKDEILLALTKQYWEQALLEMDVAVTSPSFCEALLQMYDYLRQRIRQSAGVLMHSLSGVQHAGRESMSATQQEWKEMLVRRIEQDAQISDHIWKDNFTKEQFAEFIRMNFMELLKAEDAQMQFFVLVIRRILYQT